MVVAPACDCGAAGFDDEVGVESGWRPEARTRRRRRTATGALDASVTASASTSVWRHPQHLFHVDRGRRDENVDALPVGGLERESAAASMSSGCVRAKLAITGTVDFGGDPGYGIEVTGRRRGEPGLDDVDFEPGRADAAMATLSSGDSAMPGACSPSRRVVSRDDQTVLGHDGGISLESAV